MSIRQNERPTLPGDYAVTSAHNLLAATIDSHIHHNELRRRDNIFWPRTMDMNDRALRHLVVGLGGKPSGVPRETGFVITAASETAAVLGLATSRADFDGIGLNECGWLQLDGNPIRVRFYASDRAMRWFCWNEAIMPNLVQTSETLLHLFTPGHSLTSRTAPAAWCRRKWPRRWRKCGE